MAPLKTPRWPTPACPQGSVLVRPIFISGLRDTRAFLTWLRGSCPGGLTAQFKAEKLMVVPLTANRLRAAVSALRSIDVEGVSFHNFTLPEDRCARLLVRNLSRGMPESVVREELQTACQLCLPPHRQTNSRGWHGHTGPAWYYSPLGTGARPHPAGGNCHTNYAGQ